MNKMYRYSLKRFNNLMLTMGCIRIGTLHDFRELEHKKGIGDPNEGKKTVYHTTKLQQIKSTNDPNVGKSKDFKALKEFGIMHLEDCYDVTIGEMNMARSFDTPNCYILCSSKYPSKETMTEFEGANSCIQIVNIESFYSHLTETLNTITPVIFQGIHEVIYRNDREEQWNGNDWGHRPALLKEMQFKPQGELRAIWQPRNNQSIKPVNISNYRLTGLCQKIFL